MYKTEELKEQSIKAIKEIHKISAITIERTCNLFGNLNTKKVILKCALSFIPKAAPR